MFGPTLTLSPLTGRSALTFVALEAWGAGRSGSSPQPAAARKIPVTSNKGRQDRSTRQIMLRASPGCGNRQDGKPAVPFVSVAAAGPGGNEKPTGGRSCWQDRPPVVAFIGAAGSRRANWE